MNSDHPLEILVEELSAEFALRSILPKIVPGEVFEIRVFRGKPDDDDCEQLREQLDAVATRAGFVPRGPTRGILNRIAVEELEAWFFGDFGAVSAAYPRVPVTAAAKSAFRVPDAIRGGTAEAFERLLQQHGYHKGGLAKVDAARAVSVHMDVENNQSRSFQVFRDGLRELLRIGRA